MTEDNSSTNTMGFEVVPVVVFNMQLQPDVIRKNAATYLFDYLPYTAVTVSPYSAAERRASKLNKCQVKNDAVFFYVKRTVRFYTEKVVLSYNISLFIYNALFKTLSKIYKENMY